MSVPPYVGAAICIDGVSIRKPATLNRQKSTSNVISPRYVEGKTDTRRSKTPGRSETSSYQKLGLKAGVTPKATSMEDMKKKLAGTEKLRVFDGSCVSGSISSTNCFHGTKLRRRGRGRRLKTKSEGTITKHIHLPSLQHKPTGEGREELKPAQVMIRSAGGRGDHRAEKQSKSCDESSDTENCDTLKTFKVVKDSPRHGRFPKRDLPKRAVAPKIGEYPVMDSPRFKDEEEGALVKKVRSGALKVKLRLQHHDGLSLQSGSFVGSVTDSMDSWCSSTV